MKPEVRLPHFPVPIALQPLHLTMSLPCLKTLSWLALPLGECSRLSMAFKSPADLSGLISIHSPQDPTPQAAVDPLQCLGPEDHLWESWLDMPARRGMYILLTCSSLLTLISSDSTRAMGGQEGLRHQHSTPPTCWSLGPLQSPPEAPKCNPSSAAFPAPSIPGAAIAGRPCMRAQPLGSFQAGNRGTTLSPGGQTDPGTKLGQDAGGYQPVDGDRLNSHNGYSPLSTY